MKSSFCRRYSSGESEVLQQLRKETEDSYPEAAARMISGPLQGKFLSLLATISQAKHVLELGTFTGYATIALAEGVAAANKSPSIGDKDAARFNDVKVYTCEIDSNAADMAERYFQKSGLDCLV